MSYGFTYVTDHTVRVATIPVGYADGYPRALSGRGEVLIHGRRCPILGRICMDQMMVDISAVPEAAIEDSVTLVGRDGEAFISVEEIADIMSLSAGLHAVCRASIFGEGSRVGRCRIWKIIRKDSRKAVFSHGKILLGWCGIVLKNKNLCIRHRFYMRGANKRRKS